LAFRALLDRQWLDREYDRRFVAVAGRKTEVERISQDSNMKRMVLTENGVEEDVMVVKRHVRGPRPWRISVDGPRACIDTVTAGVGYLL
jgi:hypothetical protein